MVKKADGGKILEGSPHDTAAHSKVRNQRTLRWERLANRQNATSNLGLECLGYPCCQRPESRVFWFFSHASDQFVPNSPYFNLIRTMIFQYLNLVFVKMKH